MEYVEQLDWDPCDGSEPDVAGLASQRQIPRSGSGEGAGADRVGSAGKSLGDAKWLAPAQQALGREGAVPTARTEHRPRLIGTLAEH